MVEFRKAQSENDYVLARELFVEYASTLGVDLAFQNFSNELENISAEYGPPARCIYFVYTLDGFAIGCFAIRKFEDSICELKRMYLRRDFQGKGIGKLMLRKAMAVAKELGYKHMRLDTLPTMESAIRLYNAIGFYEILPYRFNPVAGTKYFEIELASPLQD